MAETKPHNEAIEELTEAREKFLEQETARKDHLAKLKRELAEANQDEIATNRALDVLSQFKKANPPVQEPLLREFYTPSNEKVSNDWSGHLCCGGLFFGYKYLF